MKEKLFLRDEKLLLIDFWSMKISRKSQSHTYSYEYLAPGSKVRSGHVNIFFHLFYYIKNETHCMETL